MPSFLAIIYEILGRETGDSRGNDKRVEKFTL
jgi:hypothetical protein